MEYIASYGVENITVDVKMVNIPGALTARSVSKPKFSFCWEIFFIFKLDVGSVVKNVVENIVENIVENKKK